jgi:hypothetical protein
MPRDSTLARRCSRSRLQYRTRDPVVYRGLRRRLGAENLAPPLDGETPAWAQQLAGAVNDWLQEPGELDARSLVVRGAYAQLGRALYGEDQTPNSGDPSVDAYFAERLDQTDAFLLIGRIGLLGLL